MKIKINLSKVKELLRKNAALFAIGAIGAVLLLWPSAAKTDKAETEVPESEDRNEAGFSVEAEEERIRSLLESVEGVGSASVRLSVKGTEETVYMEDRRLTSDGREETATTVTVPRGSGTSEAVVVKRIKPEYVGCVVACSGAGSDSVRLWVTKAVSSLTGLSADKITVLKSK